MIIEQDLTQTSDVRELIPTGIYEWVIKGHEVKDPQDPTTKGKNLVFTLEVVNHPELAGRQMTYYVFIPSDTSRKDALTPLKRMFLSAGLPITGRGMDTRMLDGKIIKAAAEKGTYKDKRSGTLKEGSNIKEVYIPADNVAVGQGNGGAAQQSSAASVANILGGTPAPTPVSPTPASVPTSPLPA